MNSIEIKADSEILLREVGYSTSTWIDESGPVLRFEDLSLFGFVFTFNTVEDLIAQYESAEQRALSAHAFALRSAGAKAWNVYAVFLTAEPALARTERRVLRIEEDLRKTRKIARAGISTSSDLRAALLPLLPVLSQPELRATNYISRLYERIQRAANKGTADAFLSDTPVHDVARMLVE